MSRAAALALAATLASGVAHAADAADLALGKQLFVDKAAPPCGVCHALADAGTSGAVGPALDDLKPDAARVEKAVRGGIGAMPSFRATLSDAQIKAVAAYVAQASGGAN